MTDHPAHPTRRFSDRVEDYVLYRPRYPEEVLHILREETGLTPAAIMADVGSGTGISSELFLRHGNIVLGIEPNPEMRRAAEQLLGQYPQFQSVVGTAEATTLPAQSVDYVIAAQAFHWFDVQKARLETARILRAKGWAVLMWNSRRTKSTPFLRAYEALLERFGTDYQDVKQSVRARALETFFDQGVFQSRSLYNEQQFDYEGLKGRLLSSSYTPRETDPDFRPMLDELQRIFQHHAVGNRVCLEYDTELYFGRISDKTPAGDK